MVFLLQNTQNRDTKALHLKLDELIYVHRSARNILLEAEEELDDEETDEDSDEFEEETEKEPELTEEKPKKPKKPKERKTKN